MLHIAFAVVIGAKRVHRLLNLQDFLTGSMQQVKSRLSVEHLSSLMKWEQFKIREKEGKQVVDLIGKAAATLREQIR